VRQSGPNFGASDTWSHAFDDRQRGRRRGQREPEAWYMSKGAADEIFVSRIMVRDEKTRAQSYSENSS